MEVTVERDRPLLVVNGILVPRDLLAELLGGMADEFEHVVADPVGFLRHLPRREPVAPYIFLLLKGKRDRI